MKYRKKPVVIEAIQWDGKNLFEIKEFVGNSLLLHEKEVHTFNSIRTIVTGISIHTLEGDHHANVGDYIIKGVQGEFYPCKPDIFEQTYEIADDEMSMQ